VAFLADRHAHNGPVPPAQSALERLAGRPWGFSRTTPSRALTEPHSHFEAGDPVIREDRFLISHKPYAVDLTSLRNTNHEPGGRYWGVIDAVWFRRRNGVTVACIGDLWDNQNTAPADAREFLARHDDGRYGGDCAGRWDGKSYWGNVTLDQQERHLAILRPMLANYPAIPPGYDGWWTFQERR